MVSEYILMFTIKMRNAFTGELLYKIILDNM